MYCVDVNETMGCVLDVDLPRVELEVIVDVVLGDGGRGHGDAPGKAVVEVDEELTSEEWQIFVMII